MEIKVFLKVVKQKYTLKKVMSSTLKLDLLQKFRMVIKNLTKRH